MHNKSINTSNISYYAKILFVVSLSFLVYGTVLNLSNNKVYDPIKDIKKDNKSTVNITTNDDSEVVPGNSITTTEDSANSVDNDNKVENKEASGDSSDIDNTNNNLRNNIQSSYGITVKYGNETSGYTVAGIPTNQIDNSYVVNSSLIKLSQVLSLYPKGFFAEIRKGGIPLTIMLINSYEENSITGITDSSYTYATISIAVSYPFEESFYHESYHYIERYMFKKGASFTTWKMLNPTDFTYGNISNSLSYNVTFSPTAPFVNNYAQTSAEEDRASTFEYMMASSKASCLNKDMPVWKKAVTIKNTIEASYNTVNPNVVEYWERYL